jgi:hypothetical protein
VEKTDARLIGVWSGTDTRPRQDNNEDRPCFRIWCIEIHYHVKMVWRTEHCQISVLPYFSGQICVHGAKVHLLFMPFITCMSLCHKSISIFEGWVII